MLSEIQMTTVASFRGTTSLVTDKKVNLVYGLNMMDPEIWTVC